MKNKSGNSIVILLIICLGILFHFRYMNEFPSHTHAWAQSDRYALAQGFVNNELNFFTPETYVYNHQFPDNWKVPSTETITAVDFPLHDYIPAVFMKISGSTAPWLFRLYILLYSLVGLYFLFRLAKLLTNSLVKSLIVVVFAATSPVFVYYQGGFLPTIPSLANAFIAIFFYAKYILEDKKKFFHLSILFLTLATLSRTTFAIPLLAVMGYEFLRIIFKRKELKSSLSLVVPVILSVSVILGYYFYNGHLRERYGSIFLSNLMPAESLSQLWNIMKVVKEKWMLEYFSVFHYSIFLLFAGILVYTALRKKTELNAELKELSFLTGILFIGNIAFALLMTRQFPAHDYYFLDTFYLPIILLLLLVLSSIPEEILKSDRVLFSIVALILAGMMVYKAFDSQLERHRVKAWDRTTATVINFSGADEFLDSLGVPEDARILVIDAHAPNIPFIRMKRKGYAVMSTRRENIEDALSWDFDFIVTQNEFFLSEVYLPYPEIISRTKKIGDNGSISISILSKQNDSISLNEYLGLEGKVPVMEEIISFDTVYSEQWSNISTYDQISYAGKNAGIIAKDKNFGITYKSSNCDVLEGKSRILHFQSYFFQDTIHDLELVVYLSENGEHSYYKSYDLSKLLIKRKDWEKVDLLFQLPPVRSEDYEFAMYIWNRGGSELIVDDFGFRMY